MINFFNTIDNQLYINLKSNFMYFYSVGYYVVFTKTK